MTELTTPGALAALIVAISFAAGLNVYATVLSLGALARLHWVVLPPGLELLAHTWVIALSATLFAAEFVADKIPAFDLMWNLLHTFVRIPVAALLAYAATPHLSPEMHALATTAGASIALLAHSSKTAARLVVTPSPEPVSNIALSSLEDFAVIAMTWSALHFPISTGLVVTGFIVLSVGIIWWCFSRARIALRKASQRWFNPPQYPRSTPRA
jgi:hypothetical protein